MQGAVIEPEEDRAKPIASMNCLETEWFVLLHH